MKMIHKDRSAIFETKKEIEDVLEHLNGSVECQEDDLRCEGRSEDDLYSPNIEDIEMACQDLVDAINANKFPVTIVFANEGGCFESEAIESDTENIDRANEEGREY